MEFYLILAFLFAGILLGVFLKKDNYFVKFADLITKIGIVILLLAMGANLGSNNRIFIQLGEIGFQALVFAVISIIFSVIAVMFFVKIMSLNNSLLGSSHDKKIKVEKESTDNKMTILIFSSIILGILLGYSLLTNEQTAFLDTITNYSLSVLLFGVGIDIGASREIFEDLKIMGWRLIVIPILIAIGSIFGGVISGLIFDFTVGESAAVGAGFGWYSLSGILISQLHSAELGSIAFLANIFRELLTVMLLPIIAKYFGSLVAIAPGGATTMDVTLPLIKELGGEKVVIPAFISGAILTALVPILVPLFLKL